MKFNLCIFAVIFAMLLPLAAFGQDAKACPAEPREIIRQAAENDEVNDLKARSYTYTEQEEEHKLNSQGGVDSTESKTYEILFLAGEQTRKLVARNGKPLSPGDAKKEDDKLSQMIQKRARETEEQKEKRLAKEEKERQEGRAFVGEIAAAYDFRAEAPETINGRAAFVVSATPRADFHSHTRDGKYLSNFRFRAWIDQAECQWVKLDVEAIDTVSWGLFLARLHKGSRVLLEQTRVNDELWLPKSERLWLSARVALLKNYNLEEDTTFQNYQKFSAQSRIVPASPAAPAPR
jgi:hypothetical protein